MEILKKSLFIFLLIGFICGEILRFDNGSGFAVTLFDFGVFSFVTISILLACIQKKIVLNKIVKLLFAFFGVGVISLLFEFSHLTQYQLFISFLYALRFLVYSAGVYISVKSFEEKTKKQIPRLLLGTGLSMIGLGFLQFIFYPALRNLLYAGWDEHLFRLFGQFLDPNFMGLFFVLLLILLAPQILLPKKWVYRLFFIFTGIALLLTYSRGAYIAAVVGLGVYFWQKGSKRLLGIILGVLVVAFLVVSLFSRRSEGTNLLRIHSITDRLGAAQSAVVLFAKYPILGTGFDDYRYFQRTNNLLPSDSWQASHAGAGTDNSFLFVLATTGIIGFGVFVLLLTEMIRFTQKSKKEGRVALSTLTVLCVGSLFVNALFYPFFLVWMWIVMGIMD